MLAIAILCNTVPITAVASEVETETEISESVAATIAALFVLSNLNTTNWNMNTNISDIIPMYGYDELINSYCVELSNDGEAAGYVIISSDLNNALIQEYAEAGSFTAYTNNSYTSVLASDDYTTTDKIYYGGPLQYSNYKSEITAGAAVASSETVSDETNYENNSEFVNNIIETGLLPLSTSQSRSGYITSPLSYLAELYPNYTFTCTDFSNLGENAIYSYYIAEHDACAVYGVAAIIEFYMWVKYDYNTIVNACKSIAVSNGYATTTDYYIDIGDLAPFARKCCAYFGLEKSVTSSMLNIWNNGTNEISEGRPILLNIASASNYTDHTVTAYAWTQFTNSYVGTYKFFKVKDGYSTSSSTDYGRYVNNAELVLAYYTKFY